MSNKDPNKSLSVIKLFLFNHHTINGVYQALLA